MIFSFFLDRTFSCYNIWRVELFGKNVLWLKFWNNIMNWRFICNLLRSNFIFFHCFRQTWFWLFRFPFLNIYFNFYVLFLLLTLLHFLILFMLFIIFIRLALMSWFSCLTILFRFFLLILFFNLIRLWFGRECISNPWKKVSNEPRLILLINLFKQIRVKLWLKKLVQIYREISFEQKPFMLLQLIHICV